jgi:hypothetical protein
MVVIGPAGRIGSSGSADVGGGTTIAAGSLIIRRRSR